MEKLVEIRDDLFDISARIKSIDENYKIYFNRGTCRYELHNVRTSPTYQATFPYATLDKRALDFARQTNAAKAKQILEEIDAHNEALEQDRQKMLLQKTLDECL